MRIFKQVLLVVVGMFLAIVILQNTAPVRVQFLWMAGEMATVLLLFLTAVGGFVMGVVATMLLKGKGHQSRKESESPL